MSSEIINIRFKGTNLEKRLSNLYPYQFILDDIVFESFEGFIQSLKTPNIETKKNLWIKSGYDAWEKGQNIDWKTKQEVYWISTPIDRHSKTYTELITKAFDALYMNKKFKKSLKESLPYELEHTMGVTGKNNTLLTKSEFLDQLYRLRKKFSDKKFYNILDLF